MPDGRTARILSHVLAESFVTVVPGANVVVFVWLLAVESPLAIARVDRYAHETR